MKSIALTVLFCVLSISLSAQDREFHLDEVYSINQNATIFLSSDDADVTITGSDRSDVHVIIDRTVEVDGWKVESSGEFTVNVENRGGDLYIIEEDTEEFNLVLGSIDEEYQITIEAPRDVALEINGDDDSYQISNINLGIALDADDTEVEITGAKGKEFSFDIDDGSILIDEGQGELSLKMDDGELVVRQATFTEIDAEADDGEMEITTSLADNGLYLFDMDDGAIELMVTEGGGTFEIDHDDPNIEVGDAFEEVRNEEDESVYRLEGGDAEVRIDTDDGEVELRAN